MSDPQITDSPNILWAKIADKLSSDHGDSTLAPRYGDPTQRLIYKVAALISTYGL